MDGWRESGYSTFNGNCVEVRWRKPRRSLSNGHCVQVGSGRGAVEVRDSKNVHGGQLAFTPAVWAAFITSVKDGTCLTV